MFYFVRKYIVTFLLFLSFPIYRGESCKFSLRSTANFVICFHCCLFLAFPRHFYSSSAFLRSLFTQSSHLSYGLPFFASFMFICLRYFRKPLFFHSNHVSSSFRPALNYFANYTSLSSIFSLGYFTLIFFTLCTPAILLIQLFSHT